MKNRKRLTWHRLKNMMQKQYTLQWVSYDENLDEHLDIIEQCIRDRSSEYLHDTVWRWYYTAEWESIRAIIKDLQEECMWEGFTDNQVSYIFDRYEKEIIQEIRDRDDSEPATTLIEQTDSVPVRVEMLSDYDCINSHWFELQNGYRYEQSYFGDLVDALNLNPREVARIFSRHDIKCSGTFPDISERNGAEQVSYDDFMQEIENTCCGANFLTYIARINLRELYDADFAIDRIVIPKGNACGLFSSMYGGGSVMEMKLLKDVEISLQPENNSGYRLTLDCEECSVKQVYGVIDSFFGTPLKILPRQA